jgi:hypothetical protein
MKKSIVERIKLWGYLHEDDLKGVFKVFLPLLLLLIALINIPYFTRMFVVQSLDSETYGVIESIEKRKGVHESKYGGSLVIKDYKIQYRYLVKNDSFVQTEIIDRKSVKLDERIKIGKLKKGDTILVKYNSKNYNQSHLKIEK